ncbi:MAG: hypothetical protein ACTFAK_09285 [Candidatus Electronema sp. VV]
MIRKSIFLLLGLGLASGPAGAADWHVRLTVTAPDDPPPVRTDSGNVFGRLHDSVDGLDSHDLPEMPPPDGSMGARYLSIVFPHPEWGGSYDGYASDFRAAVADETIGGSWRFDVRTRTTGIRTVVSWQEGTGNPITVLPRSRIKDAASGQIVVADTSQSASFTISGTKDVNAYIWEYLGQKGPEPPTTPGRHLPPGVMHLLLKK